MRPRPRRSPSRGPRCAVVAALAVVLSACGSEQPASPGTPEARETSQAPACEPEPLERRAAVVLHVGLAEVTDPDDPLVADVVDLGVGGIFLNDGNIEDEEQLAELLAGIRARAGDAPLLVSTDEESGRVSDFRSLIGGTPSPRRLAATRTPEQVREYAADLGAQLRDYGVDMDLGPLLDLDDGPSRGIIGDRAFSADPDEAAEYGLAFARGLADAGVVPVVKHFPGHGRSTQDTHTATEVVDAPLAELRTTDLAPFQAAVDAGAPVVMLNHLAYEALDPELPASLAPEAYALLREMGFEGVAMTDSIGMGAVYPRWDFPEAAVQAVVAGADTVLASGAVLRVDPKAAHRMRDALVEAVEDGRLPEERLDEAAARVVALAGGDPMAFACVEAAAPELSAEPATAPTPTGTGRTTTPSGSPAPRTTTTAPPPTGSARPTTAPTPTSD